MKRLFSVILIIAALSTGLSRGQASQDELPGSLKKLFERLHAESLDSNRLRINDSIKLFIEDYVNSDKIFKGTFPDIKYLGQIISSDNKIKIITWNLILSGEPGKYFCYFIRRSHNQSQNKIYRLTASYDEGQISADTIYTGSDWYGALYYDIKPFHSGNSQCWALLGINYSNPQITRKMIEVLSFSADDKLILGRRCFNTGRSINYRHILEYSAHAVISLRFRSAGSIVFDHLVPLPPSPGDERIYYGPDYSYDEFTLKNGMWNLKVNADVRNKRK
jgi:hypothetical protein